MPDTSPPAPIPEGASLSTRLDRLFDRIPSPSGERYTNESAAAALRDRGVQVSAQHLWALRSGSRSNPSFALLQGIAALFGVPITYFSDDETEARVVADLDRLAALRDAGVRTVMMRAHGLSPSMLAHVSSILAEIRKLEGLDDVPPQDEPG